MPRVDVVMTARVRDSFRVRQVAGLFDVPLADRARRRFCAELPALDETIEGRPWRIGAIVGPSGSGKTALARRAYHHGLLAAGALTRGYDWPRDAAVLDAFPDDLDTRTITAALCAVGFAAPPEWVRPWGALSTGQRFRCDLARALLAPRALVVFDEFTSVVDRQVARFGAAAVARAVRDRRARCRQFVAVTCHYDVLEWLEPDWRLDTATGSLARGRLPGRPPITLDIRTGARDLWQLFRPHHYLSADLHPAARCYAALWNERPVAFCATNALLGRPRHRSVHRLVVLPDYQGLGVGLALLDAVARREAATHNLTLVTGHPALVRSLHRHRDWRRTRINRPRPSHNLYKARGRKPLPPPRITASFRYRPQPPTPRDP